MDNNNSEVVSLYLDDIIPNRFQPREYFDEQALKELAVSIKEHGVIQPIIVRKVENKYEIIAGERRYKAATMAGLTKIPAIVKNLDDKESSKVALIENLQRRDLTPIEEARTYQKILELEGEMTQEELATTIGKTQSSVSNKLRLLSLPEEVQDALLKNKISERHARSLLNLKDKIDQIKMLDRIITDKMTVREVDKEIKAMKDDKLENGLSANDIVDEDKTKSTDGDPLYEDDDPTTVDVDKIRENSVDIGGEKPTMPENDLMNKPEENKEDFKFVPSFNFKPNNANAEMPTTPANNITAALNNTPVASGTDNAFGGYFNTNVNQNEAGPNPEGGQDLNASQIVDDGFGINPAVGLSSIGINTDLNAPAVEAGAAPEVNVANQNIGAPLTAQEANPGLNVDQATVQAPPTLPVAPAAQQEQVAPAAPAAAPAVNVALADFGNNNNAIPAVTPPVDAAVNNNVASSMSQVGISIAAPTSVDVSPAIVDIFNTVTEIANKGFNVAFEENDGPQEYKITITIKK